MNMTIIHNMTSEASKEVENICDILKLTYYATISFVSDELYDYEIEINESQLVPFMIRFLHRISSDDYERLEIY